MKIDKSAVNWPIITKNRQKLIKSDINYQKKKIENYQKLDKKVDKNGLKCKNWPQINKHFWKIGENLMKMGKISAKNRELDDNWPKMWKRWTNTIKNLVKIRWNV